MSSSHRGRCFKSAGILILRKCEPNKEREIRRIFEKEPFGELERLVTQKLLDVAQSVAKEELRSEEWLRLMAQVSGRSYEQMRVAILEFLDTRSSIFPSRIASPFWIRLSTPGIWT